jgi:hypothetical protein
MATLVYLRPLVPGFLRSHIDEILDNPSMPGGILQAVYGASPSAINRLAEVDVDEGKCAKALAEATLAEKAELLSELPDAPEPRRSIREEQRLATHCCAGSSKRAPPEQPPSSNRKQNGCRGDSAAALF